MTQLAVEEPVLQARNELVVVTGASGGIGRAIVETVVQVGYQVLATDQAAPPHWDGSTENIHWASMDLADSDMEGRLGDAVARTGARWVGLVNCAFADEREYLANTTLAAVQHSLDISLTSVWRCMASFHHWVNVSRASWPCSIVNMASIHAGAAAPTFGIYSAAKAGIVALTRSAAIEWGAEGFRCNSIAPGFVKVPRNRRLWGDDATATLLAAEIPIRRLGNPIDIAQYTAFLLSPASSFITGTCLAIDGGQSARLAGVVNAQL